VGVLPARSELYGLLAEAVSFPTDAMAGAIGSGDMGDQLARLCTALPYPFAFEAGSLATEGILYDDLQSEYIRLFDAPVGGSPCPLYAGVYAASRREAMEELLRFYRHFGLTIAEGARDLPDSVGTVLEFLHFLSFREATADPPADRGALRAAQHDVLARHMVRWAAQTKARMAGREPLPCYGELVNLLDRFFVAEVGYLSRGQ